MSDRPIKATSVFRKRDLPLYFFLYLISLLPFGVMYVLSDGLSWIFWNVIKYRKKVVIENITASFPEKSEQERLLIGREFYRNLTDVILETVKLTSVTAAELKERIELEDREMVQEQIVKQKTFLILASHHCNWEWIFAIGGITYNLPIHGVYKPLTSIFFETYMRHIRTRFGGVLIKMKDTMRHLVSTRKEPKIISMIADQTPPFSEIQHWTNFLHQDTAFYAGAEKIAKSFGYPVYYVRSNRTGRGRYKLSIERIDNQVPEANHLKSEFPVIDVYAKKLEELIQAEPESYLWSHKRWKHKRVIN